MSSAYGNFWHEVGTRFPDISGAVSTHYYLANEQRLLTEHLPSLNGLRLLKTDLWDEAKNTRILRWAHDQGAHTFGIDIAAPMVWQARDAFGTRTLHATVADTRSLPFGDGVFNAIYSMGTIEHFAESDVAVQEMFRVLRPGGRAIIGVPNLYDPFLRPLLVRVLQMVGLYAYGDEVAFSRAALHKMVCGAGFEVIGDSGVLFMPGWLRMLDLACWVWLRPLSRLTGAMVRPFMWLDGRFSSLRRHGYLIATIAKKPSQIDLPHGVPESAG